MTIKNQIQTIYLYHVGYLINYQLQSLTDKNSAIRTHHSIKKNSYFQQSLCQIPSKDKHSRRHPRRATHIEIRNRNSFGDPTKISSTSIANVNGEKLFGSSKNPISEEESARNFKFEWNKETMGGNVQNTLKDFQMRRRSGFTERLFIRNPKRKQQKKDVVTVYWMNFPFAGKK